MLEARKNGPKGKDGEDASAVAEQMFSAMDGDGSVSERLAGGKDTAAMSGNRSSGTLGALLASINEVAA